MPTQDIYANLNLRNNNLFVFRNRVGIHKPNGFTGGIDQTSWAVPFEKVTSQGATNHFTALGLGSRNDHLFGSIHEIHGDSNGLLISLFNGKDNLPLARRLNFIGLWVEGSAMTVLNKE
jgi:hypothetical protein